MTAKRKYPVKAVHLNLPLDLHATITTMCAALDIKPARFITDLLAGSSPQFVQLTQIALDAKAAPLAAVASLDLMLSDASKRINTVSVDVRQLALPV